MNSYDLLAPLPSTQMHWKLVDEEKEISFSFHSDFRFHSVLKMQWEFVLFSKIFKILQHHFIFLIYVTWMIVYVLLKLFLPVNSVRSEMTGEASLVDQWSRICPPMQETWV